MGKFGGGGEPPRDWLKIRWETTGSHNVLVSRTAAEIAGERLADFNASRCGVLLQEPCHSGQYAGCTKSALQAMLFPESVLQCGKMLFIRGQTLHRRDILSLCPNA